MLSSSLPSLRSRQTNNSLFAHTAEGLSLYGAHEIGQLSAHQSLSETTSKWVWTADTLKAVLNPVNLENKQSPIKINRLVDSAAVLVHLKFILNIERQQRTSSSTVIINSGLFLSPRPPVSAHILTLRSQSYYTQPGRWMVTTGSKWIGLVSEQCKTGAGIQHKGVRQIHHHHHHHHR